MGLIDFLTESGLDPDTDRLVKGVLKRYGQEQLLSKAGSSLVDRFSGKRAYEDENAHLDIALKRRALGLQDSDDFDESRNDETPLYAAGFNGLIQRIPEPGFLSPKNASRGKTLLRSAIISGEKSNVVPGILGRLSRAFR